MAGTEGGQGQAPRRALLAGVGVVGAAATLAACGTASSTDNGSATGAGTPDGSGAANTPGAEPSTEPSSVPTTGGGNNGGGSGVKGIAKTSEIPVGGGKIVSGTVVTQPTAGTFKAFSSTCTHEGCQVNAVAGGLIKCPCHGSAFSVADGSVKKGPASSPLPSKNVTVTDGQIVVA
jgi:Rieske Fe-S protein